jgi:hypothetical protein
MTLKNMVLLLLYSPREDGNVSQVHITNVDDPNHKNTNNRKRNSPTSLPTPNKSFNHTKSLDLSNNNNENWMTNASLSSLCGIRPPTKPATRHHRLEKGWLAFDHVVLVTSDRD